MNKHGVLKNALLKKKSGMLRHSLFNRLPDPDPVAAKTDSLYAAYRELTYDAHVYACIAQRTSGTAMLKWQITQTGDARLREAVESCFAALDIDGAISQILNAIFYGFTVQEIIWKQKCEWILPARLEEKPQEWFYFDADNCLRFSGGAAGEGVLIPNQKYLLTQHRAATSNPYGERVLSRCVLPVRLKRNGMQFWNTFVERYGMPLLAVRSPKSSPDSEKEALLTSLETLLHESFGILPEDAAPEFIESSQSATSEVYKKMADFCNAEISKAILSQTLTTEVQERGTYAASRTHQAVLQHLFLGDRRMAEKTMNRLIALIREVNFPGAPDDELPRFELYREEDINKSLAERDRLIRRQGVRFTKSYYMRAYNLSADDFSITAEK